LSSAQADAPAGTCTQMQMQMQMQMQTHSLLTAGMFAPLKCMPDSMKKACQAHGQTDSRT
jgi:hypothetical protein